MAAMTPAVSLAKRFTSQLKLLASTRDAGCGRGHCVVLLRINAMAVVPTVTAAAGLPIRRRGPGRPRSRRMPGVRPPRRALPRGAAVGWSRTTAAAAKAASEIVAPGTVASARPAARQASSRVMSWPWHRAVPVRRASEGRPEPGRLWARPAKLCGRPGTAAGPVGSPDVEPGGALGEGRLVVVHCGARGDSVVPSLLGWPRSGTARRRSRVAGAGHAATQTLPGWPAGLVPGWRTPGGGRARGDSGAG